MLHDGSNIRRPYQHDRGMMPATPQVSPAMVHSFISAQGLTARYQQSMPFRIVLPPIRLPSSVGVQTERVAPRVHAGKRPAVMEEAEEAELMNAVIALHQVSKKRR